MNEINKLIKFPVKYDSIVESISDGNSEFLADLSLCDEREVIGDFIARAVNEAVWTPVEDGLPEADGRFWVTIYDTKRGAFMEDIEFRSGEWKYLIWDWQKVTAWRPLPAPYEAK